MAEDPQHLMQRALLGEAIDCLEGVAVFVWNDERHYVAVNDEACALVGSSREELIGTPVGTLSPDNAAASLARVRAGTVTDGTSSLTRRDGERVELEWTTIRTRVAGLPYWVSIVRRAGR